MSSVRAFEERSRQILSRRFFDAVFGGSHTPDLDTNRANELAFAELELRPRVMGGADCELTVSILGSVVSFPVLLAPVGLLDHYDLDGELAYARAAAKAGTVLIASVFGGHAIEEIVANGDRERVWFQVNLFDDAEITSRLVERAERAGCKAIVVTVDYLSKPTRQRRRLHGIQMGSRDSSTLLPNFRELGPVNAPTLKDMLDRVDHDATWDDLELLVRTSPLPVVVKGIQTAADALISKEVGASAVIVSNHGGHALNSLRATVRALPEIVDAVGREIEVYMDGGVRSGVDVIKALALGARAVLVGRAPLWGLTVAGEAGVDDVLDLLREQLRQAADTCGVADLSAVGRSLLDTTAAATGG